MHFVHRKISNLKSRRITNNNLKPPLINFLRRNPDEEEGDEDEKEEETNEQAATENKSRDVDDVDDNDDEKWWDYIESIKDSNANVAVNLNKIRATCKKNFNSLIVIEDDISYEKLEKKILKSVADEYKGKFQSFLIFMHSQIFMVK